MTRGPIHDIIERALTGKVTLMTPAMDALTPVLKSRHRVFGHSVDQIVLLAKSLTTTEHSFEDNLRAGLIHLWVDNHFVSGKQPGRPKKAVKPTKMPTPLWQKIMYGEEVTTHDDGKQKPKSR